MIRASLKRALRSALALLAALLLYAMPVDHARAVITYQSAGAVSDSNVTSINPAYPASVAAGDMLILIIGMKPSVANSGSATAPEGWTLIDSLVGAGGYGGTLGGDTGNTNVFAFYKLAEGNETGSLRVRLTTVNIAWAQMYRLSNATQDWSVAGTTGSDTTAGNVSITMSGDPGVTAGDFILGAMVIPTDVTTPNQFSNENFTQTGVTFAAETEISEPDAATGNDIGGFVVRSSVTAGTGSAAPVMTATAGGTTTNVRGPGIFIRVRATGTITYETPGALNYIGATVAASVCPAHPAGIADGDLLVTLIGMKPSVANSGSVTTPSGWTAVTGGSLTGAGGYGGTLGADTGNTNVFAYYRVATGTEATERCFELTTNSVSWAQMYRFSNTTQGWDLAGATGSDTTAGNVSITMSSNPGVTTGDHILGAMVIPTDVSTPAQFSAENLTQTGVTFAAETEISEPDSANGNDIGGFVIRSSVTAGTGSAAPVMTATAGGTTTNVRGPGVFIRIRELQPALTQAAFGFYEDGTESASTAIAAQDTNISRDVAPGNSVLQLRLRLQETNGASGAATDDYQLQYSKNGGAYTNVTGASANVRGFNSASLADGGATTNRLTGGSGTFLAGVISEDGLADNHQITRSRYTEYLYSLTLISADLANNNTLDFRVLRNGATINSYSVTPRINVAKPVIPGRFNAVEPGGDALTGIIKTKIAATNFSLDIAAIKVDGSGVETGFFGDVKVQIYDGSPGGTPDATTKCSPGWTLIGTTPASWTATLTNGVGTVANLNVTDAYRNARVRVAYPATGTENTIGCSTDNFAIRPASLDTVSVTDNDWSSASPGTSRTLANVTATGGNVHKAGQPFRVAATAHNSAAATTGNYNGSPVAASVTRVLPTVGECAGCTPGTVSTANWSASSGTVTTLEASYSEAGSINMILQDQSWSDVDVADSSTAERYFSSAAFNVGRFVPDHFVVSSSGSTPRFRTFGVDDSACQAPPSGNKRNFTYIGQSFGYETVPVATFTGKNAAGNTTLNYTGSLIHTSSITAVQTYTPNSATLSATVGSPTIAAGLTGTGTGTVTINSGDSFGYVRSNSAPQAAFSANISLDVTVSDASESGSGQGTITTTTAGTFSAIAFDSGNLFRYGRLRILNAVGSEKAALAVPTRTEYWTGSAFAINTLDNCTTLDRNTIVQESYAKNLNACETIVSTDPVTFVGGAGSLKLTAPGTANDGSVVLKPQLGATASGNFCNSVGGAEAGATAATKSYLQGNWTGANYDQNPAARAAFGIYGAKPRGFIFYRETY